MNVSGTFEAKGVKKDRLSMVTGDVREPFSKEVTDAKVDTITMKHFLSAFSDSDARTIVKHCGMALVPGGKILLLQVNAIPDPVVLPQAACFECALLMITVQQSCSSCSKRCLSLCNGSSFRHTAGLASLSPAQDLLLREAMLKRSML